MIFDGINTDFENVRGLLEEGDYRVIAVVSREVADRKFPRHSALREVLLKYFPKSDNQSQQPHLVLTNKNALAIVRFEVAETELEVVAAAEQIIYSLFELWTYTYSKLEGAEEANQRWKEFKDGFGVVYIEKILPEIRNMAKDLLQK